MKVNEAESLPIIDFINWALWKNTAKLPRVHAHEGLYFVAVREDGRKRNQTGDFGGPIRS